MANVNINRNLSDQFYRYKMPKLLAKVEGKGNGIKTVIVNMPEIAKSLNRPPMYPTKYFGCLLGAQVNFDSKSERYIVNGAHDPNKLQDLLDGFIQKYVLCQSCENPETILSVNKKTDVVSMNCKACGQSGTISAEQDRLAAYILKNPPPKHEAPTAEGAIAFKTNDDGEDVYCSDDMNEIDDLDSDDLDELDYGDDDEDLDQTHSQTSIKQGSSSQQDYTHSPSPSVLPAEDDDEEEEDDDDDADLDKEDQADESDHENEKNTDKVRCIYWPSCNAQDRCQFYHPTKPCRDFLRCTYGDKCLYIHPPCKFSPNCTKPKCPFSHPAVGTTGGVKRKAAPVHFRSLQTSAPKCKFGFKCTNLMCKFSHQPTEACRYGTNCLLENCPYSHPSDSMPRKKPASVFKWSAQS